MNVYEKLSFVQQRLKAPKSQFNSFGKYNYRNAEDILEALKPYEIEVGFICTLSDKIVMVGDRFYVESTAKFIDTESGESVDVTASAREELTKKGMDASQVTGSTSSYARKYALNGLYCLDDTKDADFNNQEVKSSTTEVKKTKQEVKSEVKFEKWTEEQFSILAKELKNAGMSSKQFYEKLKVKTEEDLYKHKFDDAIQVVRDLGLQTLEVAQ